jgi:hypothetical protein
MATCTLYSTGSKYTYSKYWKIGKYWQQVLAASTDKNKKISQLEVLAGQAVKDLTKG